MAQSKQKTPAQTQRSEVAAAIRARGERGSNIWLVRPPFESRDLVLNSDLQFEAFYLIEGEPAFEDIRYLPQWYEAEDSCHASGSSKELAVVTNLDRQEHAIHLVFGTESSATGGALTAVNGAIHITVRTLDSHIQRVENWRRIIPCIRRVRLHATAAIERQIVVVVHRQQRMSLRELQGLFLSLESGIFFGSVAILLRRRELCADLDTHPWSLNTQVWSAKA
ncbi:hypothetical protein P5Y53_13735 [Dyella jiangningensis]|uniref:hypothetical protein n=1 Tax=Dyella jiangningensis TaxID=1379159 RepID=UPI002410190E|nr:hypothetical protein [Dyella jiangningensis]MDG2538731.1 hypothetical protein [Dyella jiangningensis]